MSDHVAVVLAPPLDAYPPLRGVPERVLLPVVRVEPCACGTRLVQLEGDSITAVVARHEAMAAHRAWRGRRV